MPVININHFSAYKYKKQHHEDMHRTGWNWILFVSASAVHKREFIWIYWMRMRLVELNLDPLFGFETVYFLWSSYAGQQWILCLSLFVRLCDQTGFCWCPFGNVNAFCYACDSFTANADCWMVEFCYENFVANRFWLVLMMVDVEL